MEIHLIRHTTPDIEKGICYGQSDISLNDTFADESKLIPPKIVSTVDCIYTSPLKRCLVLADYLGQVFNVPVVEDDRLKEMNFGDWEMKRWNDIEQATLMQWMNNYEDERCPQGESYRDLVSRVEAFYSDVLKKEHKSIMVVTHAGVIKSSAVILQKLSLTEAMNLNVDYAGVTTMRR